MGRRVRTKTGLRTNLYVLGLAETAFGKGATLNLPRTLLAHAGLEKFVGPGSWKSDSGLRAAVQAQATHVAMVDEFTQHMKSMVGERAPAHLKGIRTLMLDLFDKADSVHLAPAYADREKSKPVTLVEPCFSIYGVGVPGQMCDGLDRGALTDGFLNRFLVFFAEDELPTRQWECGGAPPADLVADLVAFDKALEPAGVGNLQGKGKTTSLAVPTACRTVAFADDAFAAWKEVGGEQDSLIRRLTKDGDPMKDLWCRMGEHAGKVALVMAVAEDPAGRIETHHVGKARDLVVWCLTRMQCLAERRLHDSRSEAEVQRMLRVIESAGPKGIAMNPLTRRTQWLRRGDRKDHLQTLVDGGEVVTPQRPTGSRAPAIYIAASKLSDAELMEITGATSVETETSGAQPSDVNGRQGSVLTPENRANLNGDHT
jgi:hypothetical protein